MKQIFVFGASTVYGVGATTAGFADLIKRHYHQRMYGKDGLGEVYEVFNFAKSGATVDFVKENVQQLISAYGRNVPSVSVVTIGLNNTRAKNFPDNFVSTVESYKQDMIAVLDTLQQIGTKVICLGYLSVDENKTMPKSSPFSDSKSYFSNVRIQEFNSIFRELCKKRDIPFVEVNVTSKKWISTYLYKDGLHPNQKGHILIAETLIPFIENEL